MKKIHMLLAITIFANFVILAQNSSADNRTGFSREEIRSMPIDQRPQRIGHFYGRFYRYFNSGRPMFPGPSVFGTGEVKSTPISSESK